MYIIELTLKYCPFPLSVERKQLPSAQKVYDEVRGSMANTNSQFIELTCEKVVDKKITVLANEVLAVQLFEKTSLGSSNKRPGFVFESQ